MSFLARTLKGNLSHNERLEREADVELKDLLEKALGDEVRFLP